MDVRENTASRDGHAAEQLVELLVVADRQLHVAGDDARLLVVAGGVAGQLEDLSAEVLEDGGQVDRRASSDAGRGALQVLVPVDQADRELEPGLGLEERELPPEDFFPFSPRPPLPLPGIVDVVLVVVDVLLCVWRESRGSRGVSP